MTAPEVGGTEAQKMVSDILNDIAKSLERDTKQYVGERCTEKLMEDVRSNVQNNVDYRARDGWCNSVNVIATTWVGLYPSTWMLRLPYAWVMRKLGKRAGFELPGDSIRVDVTCMPESVPCATGRVDISLNVTK